MSVRSEISSVGLVLLCAGVACTTSGCLTRRAPRPSIGKMVILLPPVPPVATAGDLPTPPEIAFGLPESPELGLVRSVPARPHVAAAPASDSVRSDREAEPQILPELSSAELDAAKAETQQNLDTMRRNLAAASGRSLNASQQDLISKARGFAAGAHDAMRSGDWERAKNLSKKAEVLSQELVDSL